MLTSSPALRSSPAKFLTSCTARSDDADELKRTRRDAVENMYGDMHIKYLTFLRMLSRPRAQTVLVDGALREGELLIPLPSLEILVLLTFCSPSTGVKSTERVEAVYPLLKDVALSPDMSFCVDYLFEGL
ncbi:hypothetical protein HID58_012919 [Brassica napus]|uniref:Uncharacterized protein n=1 Tax=Brassica napus TaxID=3708 RepID=A0ABQ8E2E6_BRANA|nr:hypothetical protein HID58_009226 [Brassica napus]KAH0935802.1 hypothetical protein HID58_012919 [Brassica napus]